MKKEKDGLEAYIGISFLVVTLYTGLNMLYLMVLYSLIFFLGKKYLSSSAAPYVQTVAIQASLIILPIVYLVVLYTKDFLYFSNVFELCISCFTLIGLVWLIHRPTLNPIIMLTVFHSILIALGLRELSNMEIGSVFHRALANLAIWRIVGLILMWTTYSRSIACRF